MDKRNRNILKRNFATETPKTAIYDDSGPYFLIIKSSELHYINREHTHQALNRYFKKPWYNQLR